MHESIELVGTPLHTAFLMSIEQELMTVVAGEGALGQVLRRVASLAPAVRDFGNGYFNPYGRIYVDLNSHVELAALECDDPYELALWVETQHALLARATHDLAAEGVRARFFANNHDGLLHSATATWGAHENYLVARPTETFGDEILPFLATRVYGGAGGVRFPSGDFVAGVRSLFMVHDAGGDTVRERALHSTVRQEHHAGGRRDRFRYHLVLGDSHRSHFNLALKVGATALVLRAIETDDALRPGLRALAQRLHLPRGGSWVETLRLCNTLATPDAEPRVHPLALEVQTFYLEAAQRWAASVSSPPPWVHRCLRDWRDTLHAMTRGDLDWLAERLDAFAKHRLLHTLAHKHGQWPRTPADRARFVSLQLIEHAYHDISHAANVFTRLERAGLLQHRVGDPRPAGTEPEPHVPAVNTRARPRARFITEHARQPGVMLDWSYAHDTTGRRTRKLTDPFATAFDPWVAIPPPPSPARTRPPATRPADSP